MQRVNIVKGNDFVTVSKDDKEFTIEKNDKDKITLLFYNNNINSQFDKCIGIDKSCGQIYYNFKSFYDKLKSEYNKYKTYFDKIYDSFIDEHGNMRNIMLYNSKHDSFKFYSNDGNFSNNIYIRLFKEKDEYYLYFNKPNKPFVICEDNSKYNYNSFYKYFLEFYNSMKEEKNNKKYIKINNFKFEDSGK